MKPCHIKMVMVAVVLGGGPLAAKTDCATDIAAYRKPECDAFFRNRIPAPPVMQAQPGTNLPNLNPHAEKKALPWRSATSSDVIADERVDYVAQWNRAGVIRPHRRPTNHGHEVGLIFSCSNKKAFYVSVTFPGALVAGYRQTVTYRVDERTPVVSLNWQKSTDNSAVAQWETAGAVAFLRQLQGGRKLLFRIEQDSFGTAEAGFDVEDIMRATEPVRQACKIPVPAARR